MECTLYLTDDCNLRCKYCYEGKRKNRSYMTEETLKAALAFIAKYNIKDDKIDLILLGGEPLLNRSLLYKTIEIVNESYKDISGLFRYQITTNGILLEPEMVHFLEENNVAISISIDGDRETHNLNRQSRNGKDSYDLIMKNMRYMIENKIDFAARMTVTVNNVHLLFSNIRYLYNLGVRKINVGIDECGPWNEKDFTEFDEQMNKIDRFYLDHFADDADAVLNIYDYKLSTFVFKRTPLFCSAGSANHIVINSKGDLFPCGYVGNTELWKIGSVYSGLDSKKFFQTVRQNVKPRSSCKDCEIAFTCCGAKCGFMNYEMSGYLNVHHEKTCKLQTILYLHDKNVIQSLYRQYNPKLMKLIELAFQEKIPLSGCMLEIMASVESERKVI